MFFFFYQNFSVKNKLSTKLVPRFNINFHEIYGIKTYFLAITLTAASSLCFLESLHESTNDNIFFEESLSSGKMLFKVDGKEI